MFKANRVGTPVIHTDEAIASTIDFSIAVNPANGSYSANNINASATQKFGESGLRWTGGAAETLPAANRWMIGQWFSVTTPRGGDVVGVELNGAYVGGLLNSCLIIPFIARLDTPPAGLLSNTALSGYPTYFGTPIQGWPTENDSYRRGATYKEQVIIRQLDGDPAGNYIHGFAITDNSGTPSSISSFLIQCSIRQLVDQPSIGYVDTRR